MNSSAYAEYRSLLDSGVKVSKGNVGLRFNAGGMSETFSHSTTKAIVSHIGLRNGYKCDSEVEVVKDQELIGEVDVLLWGHPERLSYAVEAETSPTEEVVEDKLDRYVHSNNVIDDMILINTNDVPIDRIEAEQFIGDELGLDV